VGGPVRGGARPGPRALAGGPGLPAAAAPDAVDGEADHGQAHRGRAEDDLGPGHLPGDLLPELADIVGRADLLGQRIDRAGQVLPGPLDLGNDHVGTLLGHRAAHGDRALHLDCPFRIGHYSRPS
jgi:hypothetical protein